MTDRDNDLADVRRLTAGFRAGGTESFRQWGELAGLLLRRSVAADGAGLTFDFKSGHPDVTQVLRGGFPADEHSCLSLRDGRFLRFSQTLVLATTKDGPRLKVAENSYQYQSDLDSRDWLFRYDYTRLRDDHHPAGHFHVRAVADMPNALANSRYSELDRIHFPTRRMSLEAVIRLLVVQLGVPPATNYWDVLLDEAERLFMEIAHDPSMTGPS